MAQRENRYVGVTEKIVAELPSRVDQVKYDMLKAYVNHREEKGRKVNGLGKNLYDVAEKAFYENVLKVAKPEDFVGNAVLSELAGTYIGKRENLENIDKLGEVNVNDITGLVLGIGQGLEKRLTGTVLSSEEKKENIDELRDYVETVGPRMGIKPTKIKTIKGAMSEYIKLLNKIKQTREEARTEVLKGQLQENVEEEE